MWNLTHERIEADENREHGPKLVSRRPRPAQNRRRTTWVFIAVGTPVVLLAAGAILLHLYWPFSARKVAQDLADASSSKVVIQRYRPIYFPHPGGVAEGVVFRHDNIATPLITIRRLTIRGSYLGMITKHVAVLRAEGVRMVLPPFGTNGNWSNQSSDIVIDELIADKSLLIVPPGEPGKKPLEFQIGEFTIHSLGRNHTMDFRTVLTNPSPPGEIRSEGKIGPWKDKMDETSIIGSYTFQHAELGALAGIAGTLWSKGSFRGTFRELSVAGSTTTTDFEVKRSGHQHRLDTDFQAVVNTTNGDVTLKSVDAQLDNTRLVVRGSIEGRPGQKGKTTSLEIVVRGGRMEDLMLLFVREKRSPLDGEISFHALTQIPPGDEPFLKKVRLRGDFGVDAAHFTNRKTQNSMDKLSTSAQGHPDNPDPSRVLSGLKGHVDVNAGAATFTDLFFDVPGAAVTMHGTFGLTTQRVDLHGFMRMQAKPSKATTGVKSFLMKVLDPFTNKDRGRVPIPVGITGTYDHPHYQAGTPK